MANTLQLKNDIKKLKLGLKSKGLSASIKDKLKTQLTKVENELKSAQAGAPPRKVSTTKSTKDALDSLKQLIKKKGYGVYQNAGVDLKKDAQEGALATGRRVSKGLKGNQYGDKASSIGHVYYEYRANRLDVKQPKGKQKYPKLAHGGETQGYDDREDERLGMKYGKITNKDLNSTHARRDDARFEERMAKGGEVDRERMYNFLKDDLVALKKAIEVNNQEEIEKFFSYWNIHLKSLEPKTGSKRMYQFLKDDLVGLEAATKELPSSKEETDRFFSYWNTHLKSLSDEDLMNMMAKGGKLEKYVVEKDKDGSYRILNTEKGMYVDQTFKTKSSAESWKKEKDLQRERFGMESYFAKGGKLIGKQKNLDVNENGKLDAEDFKMLRKQRMAEGGKLKIGGEDFSFLLKLSDIELSKRLDLVRKQQDINGKQYFEAKSKNESTQKYEDSRKNLDNQERAIIEARVRKMAKGGYMAEGGVTEKEVVDSNAQMVLSKIKEVHHHADELGDIVTKNSDIEAWVVAKIERASTDLSDITHYLDGQHEKMSMGGSVYHHVHKMDKK